jgi:hypothetical protein
MKWNPPHESIPNENGLPSKVIFPDENHVGAGNSGRCFQRRLFFVALARSQFLVVCPRLG